MSVKRKPAQSKLWAGRFRGKTDPQVETFTSSLAIDRRLYRHDIAGSIAHCRTLERAGVLTRREADKLVAGLKQVEKEIAGGRFRFMPAHEDVHMAIEARLTELVGEVGGKLHTGRSRNDQVALDLRLYLRDAVKDLLAGLRRFQESLVALARRELSVVMPGYTHMQRAQPVLFAHHLLAYVELAERCCTGSRMTPQKKNPDVPELIRGKTGRVYGHLMSLLTVLKGLPLSYNRDLQEDKGPLFDAVETVQDSLGMLASLVGGLTVRGEAMARAAASGFLLATELADYLVIKGVPFRTVHATVGRIVRDRLDCGKDLADITLDELRSFSPAFEKDALDVLSVEGALERKLQIGGTARKRVESRLKVLQKELRAEG